MSYKHKEDRAKFEVRRRARRKLITWKLKEKPCKDCGIQYPPYVMQFDHISNDKKFSIGRGLASRKIEDLLEEIKKCEVVCANCHAERTYARQFGDQFRQDH